MINTQNPIELRKYRAPDGSVPIDNWLAGLRDPLARIAVLKRLKRLQHGLEGHWRSVGRGVRELKIATGPGYRIYYAWHGPGMVVALGGGDKRSQRADIRNAITYWNDYQSTQ